MNDAIIRICPRFLFVTPDNRFFSYPEVDPKNRPLFFELSRKKGDGAFINIQWKDRKINDLINELQGHIIFHRLNDIVRVEIDENNFYEKISEFVAQVRNDKIQLPSGLIACPLAIALSENMKFLNSESKLLNNQMLFILKYNGDFPSTTKAKKYIANLEKINKFQRSHYNDRYIYADSLEDIAMKWFREFFTRNYTQIILDRDFNTNRSALSTIK